MEEGVKEIKVSNENTIDLQPFWAAFKAAKVEVSKQKRVMAMNMAAAEAARMRFWMRVEELYPETIDGIWGMHEDTWTIKAKEDGQEGMPPGLPEFLRGIFGGGE